MSDSLSATAVLDEAADGGQPSVNDLTIHVATVNGSGSQSSNNVLMRSIFQMGIPVSGKNMFPSNIAGLPTYSLAAAETDEADYDVVVSNTADEATSAAGALSVNDPVSFIQHPYLISSPFFLPSVLASSFVGSLFS